MCSRELVRHNSAYLFKNILLILFKKYMDSINHLSDFFKSQPHYHQHDPGLGRRCCCLCRVATMLLAP